MGLDEGDGGDQTVRGNVGADADGKGHEEAEAELEHELAFLAEALLLMLEHLDVVVQEADAAAPYRGDYQQYGVDAVQTADQQDGAQQRHEDDEAAHSGGAFLLHLAFEAEVAYALADLVLLQPAYDAAAREECDKHTDHDGEHCPE